MILLAIINKNRWGEKEKDKKARPVLAKCHTDSHNADHGEAAFNWVKSNDVCYLLGFCYEILYQKNTNIRQKTDK